MLFVNYTDPSFKKEYGYYNYQEEYVYEYDLTGKIVNKVLAWNGSVGNEYVGRGFDFDRISKVNDLYFFFSGLKCLGFTIWMVNKLLIDGIEILMIMATMMKTINGYPFL